MDSSSLQNKHNQDAINSLEKQLEYGGFYTHSILSQFADRINENEAFLFGLIDYLIEKSNLSPDELKQFVGNVRNEIHHKDVALHPGIALRIDKEQTGAHKEFTPVNCKERLPICKAVCCRLNFALSPDEVESGKIKWEIGHPYFIRHKPNGCCSHLNSDNHCCTIYENRPRVCKKYSCAKDERIWKDFENMILNKEWIEQNLGEKKPRIFSISMNKQL